MSDQVSILVGQNRNVVGRFLLLLLLLLLLLFFYYYFYFYVEVPLK